MFKQKDIIRIKQNQHIAVVLCFLPRKNRVCIFDFILMRGYIVGVSDIEPFDPNDGTNGGGNNPTQIRFTDAEVSDLKKLLRINSNALDTETVRYKTQSQLMLIHVLKRIHAQLVHENKAVCLAHS